MSYITFHNHDTKSLLDSCLKVKDLVSWAKANNMSHVGVTNHGEMSSLLELYKECNKQGVKPILGEEFYVTENKVDSEGKRIRDNWHLIVLAKNRQGWDNMTKLHNLSYREERYYYDPRITLEDLFKYKEGLVITSACIGGVIARPWGSDDLEKAEQITQDLKREFGEDFYLELQNHNSEDLKDRERQHNYNRFLIRLSKKYDIKCIIQNDSHYYLKQDWVAHQVLLCKNTGSKLSNPKFKFDSHEYYLKTEPEMWDMFDDYAHTFVQNCFDNTSEIASKIEEFCITNSKYDCPVFGEPEESYKKLVDSIYNGLHRKFTDEFLKSHPEYEERLEYEIGVVKQVNFIDYFLMLEDLYKFTSSNGIYMGIGRGSAGGSLALYCLDVIQVDPIKYHLLFERFINVDRVSMCDVDCDVNDKDRPKVIEYLKKRYGVDHVCNIGTYGELTAKASFKAVASVLEIPFDKANSLSGMMDSNLSLVENYATIDTFRCACENDETINKAYKIALVLEGTYAQRGTHACGMIISSKPLDDVCPCVTVKDTKTKERIVSTTFEMKEVDGDLKLLKLDILGLRNLGILEEADKFIQKRHGKHPDYKNLDVEDTKTYNTLSAGYTCGVFQFESQLMQRIIKEVQPKSIEDLSCITALARPGCLDSGLTETFIKRRRGDEPTVPFVEGTEKYMEDTLQLPIYQENIMQISRVMAGFSGSEADTLRKCISGDSIISLDNGYKTIEEMYNNKNEYIGQKIFSVRGDNKIVKDTIVDIFNNGKAKVYKVRTQNGYTLNCTKTHKLLCLNGFKQLKDIEIGAHICTAPVIADIHWDKIVSIEEVGETHVYDLQTETYHNYFANNVVVHNCIGKKDPVKLKAERTHFVNGAVALGHDETFANEVFDDIEKFGNYGFNKSHAVGYSLLSYATAYYKTNYPVEFLTALLNSVTDDLDKMNMYIGECLRLGISILPPDINESDKDFAINEKGEIRFGLNAIKGLGKSAITQIITARRNGKFTSLIDFIERTSRVDKGNIQSLLRVGALNSIEEHPKRWDVMADFLNEGKQSKYYTESGNLEDSICRVIGYKEARKSDVYEHIAQAKRGLGGSRADLLKKQEYTERQEKVMQIFYENKVKYFLQFNNYEIKERITNELDLLGFNITTNPYKRWEKFHRFFVTDDDSQGIPYIEMNDILENPEKYARLEKFNTVGLLSDIKELKTKRGGKMARLTLEYFGTKTEITVFPTQWEGNIEFKVQKGNMISIIGKLVETNKQYSSEDYEIRFYNMRQLDVLVSEDCKCFIDVDPEKLDRTDFIVKKFAHSEREANLPIKKALFYRIGRMVRPLCGLCWVNDENKLAEKLN